MHPTLTFLQRRLPIHITLFTRRTCSLCDKARTELSRVWDRRPFEYAEVDVMRDDRWRVYVCPPFLSLLCMVGRSVANRLC